MSSRHEKIGIYRGLTHHKCCWENSDGSQTIIGRVELADGSEETIKGTVYPGQLVTGLGYRFYGILKPYKGNEQFVFESFVTEVPACEDSVVAYLTQCRGIGPVVARNIFRQYGPNSVAKLREHPESVAETTPRLKLEAAIEASRFLKTFEKIERSKIDLLGLLKGRNLPKQIIDNLLDIYGAEAAYVVSRNPYVLMKHKGVGFLKADKLYVELGLPPKKMKRQALCAWYGVSKAGDGDTWHPFAIVRNALRESSIHSAEVDVERALALAVRAKLLVEKFRDGQRWVAEYSKASDEETIATRIDEASRESRPVLWRDVFSEIPDISDHQRENLRIATREFIGILGGRPGGGKSYVIARFVKRLAEKFGIDSITVVAPAGKPAVRVTACMDSVGLSIAARTIHSALGFNGDSFQFNRFKTLPYTFIIVDEDSMVCASIKRALLDARAEGCHILFVGDVNQLAPVGHGAPLRDFIAAGIPYGELKEVRRNSGRIVLACSEIVDARRFRPSEKLDVSIGENLVMIDRDSAESQIDTLVALVRRFQREHSEGKLGAVDPTWDVQVIVPVNKKSELGRKPLNKLLQDLLNPDGRRVEGNPFRVGDKIINRKNGHYKKVVTDKEKSDAWHERDNQPSDETECYVANGEQAEVVDVDATKTVVRLASPDRLLLIPRSNKSQGDDDDADDDSTGTGCYWELGYAISGHNSQGSEWKYSIVMIDDYGGAKRVQSKQYLYTVISRAKAICFVIGQFKTANGCCSRDALFQRKTFLRERILELRGRIELTTEIADLLTAGI